MIKVQINVIDRSCHRPGHWIQRADGPVAQNGRDYKDRRVGGAGAFHHFPKPQLIKQRIEAVYVMNVFQTIEMIHREAELGIVEICHTCPTYISATGPTGIKKRRAGRLNLFFRLNNVIV